MHLLYVDESGTPSDPTLNHFGDGRENGQNRTLSMRPVRLRP